MLVEEEFVAELGRVSRRWRAELDERLRHTGLTQARWLALFQVSQQEGALTQRELADLLGIEGPTLVRILDGLEKQGLIRVERESKAPGTARKRLYYGVTAKGRAALREDSETWSTISRGMRLVLGDAHA